MLAEVLLRCSGSFQSQSGFGAGIEAGIHLVEGNEIVLIGVVEGEDERDGIVGDALVFFVGHARGDFAPGKVAITIVIEAIEALLEGDEFAGHDIPLRVGVGHVIVGRPGTGDKEERERKEKLCDHEVWIKNTRDCLEPVGIDEFLARRREI